MMTLFQKLNLQPFFAIFFAIISINFCNCAEQDLLEQRATRTTESTAQKSADISWNLLENTIHPSRDPARLARELSALKSDCQRLFDDAEIIERDIDNIKTHILRVEAQLEQVRHRPNKQDLENYLDSDRDKSCCFIVQHAAKSLIVDNWLFFKSKKQETSRITNCKYDIFGICICCNCMGILFYSLPYAHHAHEINQKQHNIDDMAKISTFCRQHFIDTPHHEPLISGAILARQPRLHDRPQEPFKAKLPTSSNPDFYYPIAPYKKPEYLQWQAGIYRKSQQKTK